MWSFSPPEEVLYEKSYAPSTPITGPARPLSAIEYRSNSQDQAMQGIITHEVSYPRDDIEMVDAVPSTAPPQATGPTFFHEDD